MKKILKMLINVSTFIGIILLFIPVIIILYYVFSTPQVTVYDPIKENEILLRPVFTDSTDPRKIPADFTDPFLQNNAVKKSDKPLELTIPEKEVVNIGTRLIIPSIGVDTTVYESWNIEDALSMGVWRDLYYGVPDRQENVPIVLTAYRWGDSSFTSDFRSQNLFVNLDKLEIDAEISLIWNEIEYRYRVSNIEKSENAYRNTDLILYTTFDFKTSERLFIYADLIN